MNLRVYPATVLALLLLFSIQAKAAGHANGNLNNAGFNAHAVISFGIVFLGLAGIIFGICAVKTAKPSTEIVSVKV